MLNAKSVKRYTDVKSTEVSLHSLCQMEINTFPTISFGGFKETNKLDYSIQREIENKPLTV